MPAASRAPDVITDAGRDVHQRLPIEARAWALWILVVLLVPTAAIEIRMVLTRPFWYDEVVTAAVVGVGSPAAIWASLARGIDTQPPFFFLVAKLGTYLTSDPHLAYRLPGLLGFFVVPFCMYAFVARRVGAMGGLIAAMVPVLSGFEPYAAEARPYGFLVGCLAIALVCWQRLESRRWMVLPFAAALIAAVASHYYAILAVAAFGVAELVRWYRTGRFRVTVWLPLAVSVVPLVIALPLMRTIRDVYGSHFWARNNHLALAVSYFRLTTLGDVLTSGVAVVLFAVVADMALRSRNRPLLGVMTEPTPKVPPEECVIALYLMALPFVTTVALTLTHGGLIMRYILPTVLGFAIATGFAAVAFGRHVTIALLAALVVSHAYTSLDRGLQTFRGLSRSPVENSMMPRVERLVEGLAPEDAPVVVSGGSDFLPLAFYARGPVGQRLMTVVDSAAAVEEIGTDSQDIELPIMKDYLRMNVQQFAPFTRAHRRFFLVSSGGPFDWWPGRLLKDGHRLTLRREQGGLRLYDVELVP